MPLQIDGDVLILLVRVVAAGAGASRGRIVWDIHVVVQGKSGITSEWTADTTTHRVSIESG